MKRITLYFQNAWAELAKVNWPKPRQAVRLTLIVVAFAAAFGIFIGLVDLVFKELLQKLILKG